LRKVAVAKILYQLGGRLRVAISGGGRLDEPIAKCLLGFGLDADVPAALGSSEAKKAALKRIAAQMQEFLSFARIRNVYLALDSWTVDNGLMTATQKLRHAKILERYEEAIAALYARR
jgi:long-chain acyl-CoA synthetase